MTFAFGRAGCGFICTWRGQQGAGPGRPRVQEAAEPGFPVPPRPVGSHGLRRPRAALASCEPPAQGRPVRRHFRLAPQTAAPLQAPRVGAPLFSLSPSSGLASVRPVPGELAPRSPRTREPVRLLSLTPGPGPPQRLWVSRCFPAPDTQASQPRAPGVPGRVRAAATCRGWGDGQTGPLPDAWRLRPSHRLGDRLQGALRPGPGRPLQAGPETSRALHPPVAPGDAERPVEASAPEEAPLCSFAEGAASLQPPCSGQQPLQALTRLC